MQFYEGQRVLVEIQYRLRGVPTDPIVRQVFIKKPSGSTIDIVYPDPAFTRVGLGEYEVAYTLDEGGTWWFRAEGIGTIDGVNEVPLEVLPTSF